MHRTPIAALLLHLVIAAGVLFSTACSATRSVSDEPPAYHGAISDLSSSPLLFIPQQGVADGAAFQARSLGGVLQFSPQEVAFAPARATNKAPRAISWRFLDANEAPTLSGLNPQPGRVSYMIGHDPSQWSTDLPTYAGVTYQSLYPHIDLRYEGDQEQVKATYTVAPGGNPSAIRWRYESVDEVTIQPDGSLRILPTGAAGDVLSEAAPVAWQDLPGGRVMVDVAFRYVEGESVGFELGEYDPAYVLTIDPTIAFSTYLGGSGAESAYYVDTDAAGNIYVGGYTTSANFPVMAAYQSTRPPLSTADIFLTKYRPDGTVIFSTYLGGSGIDHSAGMAVDSQGNALIVGHSTSADYPLASPYQATLRGPRDVVVTKVAADGGSLLYSTYLGGSGEDYAYEAAIAPDDSLVLVGFVSSADYPIVSPIQSQYGGGSFDATVSRLSADGQTLLSSTYLGGSGEDKAFNVAVGADGDIYVTGYTASSNFPTLQPFQVNRHGDTDVFALRISATSKNLVYSTYIGGETADVGYGLAVDSDGNAYIAGTTLSYGFPVVQALQPTLGGYQDGFLTKVAADGQSLGYSTYIGNTAFDDAASVVLDRQATAYVAGRIGSSNYPVVNPVQAQYGGGAADAYVTAIDAQGSTRRFSTWLGGSGGDNAVDIALAPDGLLYVAGITTSTAFPLQSPAQAQYGGGGDTFLVGLDGVAPLAPAISVTPAGLAFEATIGGAPASAQRLTLSARGVSSAGWSASADQGWIELSAAAGEAPGTLDITIDVDGLAAGGYSGTITIAPTDSQLKAQHIPVTLKLNSPPPAPELTLAPTTLTFRVVAGTNDAPSQSVAITHSGAPALLWSAAANQPWLKLSPASGTAPASLEVHAQTAGLKPGSYQATITVGLSAADATPKQIAVALTVDPSEPHSEIDLHARPGYRGIALDWEPARAPGVATYRVLRAPEGQPALAEIRRTRDTHLLDTDSALAPGTRYCYRVQALNAKSAVVAQSNLGCAMFGQVALSVPSVRGAPGSLAIIPVNIANAQSLRIAATDIWLDIDRSVIEPVEVRATPLSAGYTWSYGVSGSGAETRVRIAALSSVSSPLVGDGSLFWLVVRVHGAAGDASPLDLREYVAAVGGSTIYTTDNLSQPLPLILEDGAFTVGAGYGLGDLNGNGTIEAVDAYIALQIAVGQIKPSTNQLKAGDVNCNGRIDSGDAALILYHAAHSDWPTLPASNAAAGHPTLMSALDAQAVQISLSDAGGEPGAQVTTSVQVSGLGGWAGGRFVIAYDPAIVDRIDGVSLTSASEGFGLRFYDDGAGLLTIALADDSEHTSSGTLLTIRLTVAQDAPEGSESPLALADAQLNDLSGRDFATSAIDTPVTRSNGTLRVSETTAETQVYLPIIRR